MGKISSLPASISNIRDILGKRQRRMQITSRIYHIQRPGYGIIECSSNGGKGCGKVKSIQTDKKNRHDKYYTISHQKHITGTYRSVFNSFPSSFVTLIYLG